VVVDNRPGAGGAIGTAMVAKSPTDGYTLLFVGNGHAVNPALYNKLPYDTLKDFVEIAGVASLAQVLVVSPSAGVKSVSELIASAKARPGQITFASPGTGSGVHFTGEIFKLAAGIDVVHVAYKGGPEAMNDVMMGRVTYWIPSVATALPFIQGGKLRPLGPALASALRGCQMFRPLQRPESPASSIHYGLAYGRQLVRLRPLWTNLRMTPRKLAWQRMCATDSQRSRPSR
jgi:tripartite-type tricarboxylate transporter receptor subunit TctC